MTRTTRDLIDDLDNAVTGQGASCDRAQTALVVGFDLECRMIFQDESDRLQKLNTLVRNGGIPLGFIKVVKVGDDLQFFSRPLTGFEKNPKILRILNELCTMVGKMMASGEEVF